MRDLGAAMANGPGGPLIVDRGDPYRSVFHSSALFVSRGALLTCTGLNVAFGNEHSYPEGFIGGGYACVQSKDGLLISVLLW